MKNELIENQQKIQPAYMALLDWELIPCRTLDDAIKLANKDQDVIEIYQRHGTTGPCFYEYLCNVTVMERN